MNHAMLRVNRYFEGGFYMGITSDLTFYRKFDSAVIRLIPDKFTITDRGSGYIVGVQFGYKYPLSRRLDLAGEVAWLYNGVAAYKKLGGVLYAPNYTYSMYPVFFTLHYKFGINSEARSKDKKDKKEKPKKYKSYEDEEWGK